MAGKKNFEAQLAALEELREQPDAACIAPLRAALRNHNNFLVAKAADLVAQRRMAELVEDLLAAFGRFLDQPAKADPQCWAKNALSRALAALEWQEPEPFLRGMRHVQPEPVWGGMSDTAGTLRGICALALVQCRGLPEPELLRHLLDVLVDADKAVRGNAIRAIEQVGSSSALLLLRLRAQIGRDEPEILGGCYAAVLGIEGVSALPWASRFLAGEDDAAGEAALAMASTHSPEAFHLLKHAVGKAHDSWFRSVLLSAIALTRQSAAVEFLLQMVEDDEIGADHAVEALLRATPSEEVILKLKALVALHPRLKRVFEEQP